MDYPKSEKNLVKKVIEMKSCMTGSDPIRYGSKLIYETIVLPEPILVSLN